MLVEEVEAVQIWTAGSLVLDEDWQETDANGHEHYCDPADATRYPTLAWTIDRSYWCEKCQEWHEEGHWVCRECGEAIEPGTKIEPPRPLTRPGNVTHRLDGEPIDQAEFQMYVNKLEEERRDGNGQ